MYYSCMAKDSIIRVVVCLITMDLEWYNIGYNNTILYGIGAARFDDQERLAK